MTKHRIQKLLAEAGIASRRKAEDLLREGKVKVNGVTKSIGDKATRSDTITVDNKKVIFTEYHYIMLHKPKGYLCTAFDPRKRKTVYELVPKVPGLKHIGRLDQDTTGLLLFTNDGDFFHSIAHPSKEVAKTYIAELNRAFSREDLNRLNKGIRGKKVTVEKVKARTLSNNTVEVTLHVGQKHVVKLLFEELGYNVIGLHRSHVGGLGLGNLQVGKWEELDTKLRSQIFL